MGSTKQIANSTQTTTDNFQYDAFGLQTGRTGTTPTPFGFAGAWGYQSDGTGLQLLGHRYYDPGTGRFLTRDPVKDGRNWYGYCENRPMVGVDPTGTVGPVIYLAYIAVVAILSVGIADAPTYDRDPAHLDKAREWLVDWKLGAIQSIVDLVTNRPAPTHKSRPTENPDPMPGVYFGTAKNGKQ